MLNWDFDNAELDKARSERIEKIIAQTREPENRTETMYRLNSQDQAVMRCIENDEPLGPLLKSFGLSPETIEKILPETASIEAKPVLDRAPQPQAEPLLDRQVTGLTPEHSTSDYLAGLAQRAANQEAQNQQGQARDNTPAAEAEPLFDRVARPPSRDYSALNETHEKVASDYLASLRARAADQETQRQQSQTRDNDRDRE